MATETSAGNRPDGRHTAEREQTVHEAAAQEPADQEAAAPEPVSADAAEQRPTATAPSDDPASDPDLAGIAAALLQLRKSWAKPDLMKRVRAQTPAGTDGRPLQISNLMVVNAVAALTADAAQSGAAQSGAAQPGTTEPGTTEPVAAQSGTAQSGSAEFATGHPGGTEEPGRAGGAAEPPPEITVGAVAERLEIDPSTASRLVGHAIDAGLLSRRPSPVDARRANLGLTEAGRRVKQVADRFRRAYLDELMSGWTPGERAEFARLLTRFADAAARAPGYSDGIGKIFEEARAD